MRYRDLKRGNARTVGVQDLKATEHFGPPKAGEEIPDAERRGRKCRNIVQHLALAAYSAGDFRPLLRRSHSIRAPSELYRTYEISKSRKVPS